MVQSAFACRGFCSILLRVSEPACGIGIGIDGGEVVYAMLAF